MYDRHGRTLTSPKYCDGRVTYTYNSGQGSYSPGRCSVSELHLSTSERDLLEFLRDLDSLEEYRELLSRQP